LVVLEGLVLCLMLVEYLWVVVFELVCIVWEFFVDVVEYGIFMWYDDEWYDLLFSGCFNGCLMELIIIFKFVLYCYELYMVFDEKLIGWVASEYVVIVKCLLDGDVDVVVMVLEVNWINGMDWVLVSFDVKDG